VLTYRTASEEETVALGERLAGELSSRAVVLLTGNLGAGKTTLAKGIVKGLGAAEPDEVSSPTFTLIHEYPLRDPKGSGERTNVYHVDLYRLDRSSEAATLGIEELLEKDAVVLVEWGERFPALWPAERIEIRIEPRGGDQREITVTGRGL
jgi:tRNA threonylcarbamoyladenosine biosynthesis protein TsaE